METHLFDKDITVFYLEASVFPQGVQEVHDRLRVLVPVTASRKYFGISRPENGVIKYKAAAEELVPGEAISLKLDTMVLKMGNYIFLTVTDYANNLEAISQTFEQLLKHPDIDPQGYCVEWYFNDTDVRCMVRVEN